MRNGMGGAHNVWVGGKVHIGFLWGNLKKEHLQDSGIDGRKILKCIFKKWDGKAWTGLIWLRIGTVGRLS